MKTAVAQTSIDAFYVSELMALVPGIDKSSMSRVVNGLRAARRLQEAPARKCTVTGVTIIPSRLPVKEQGSLF